MPLSKLGPTTEARDILAGTTWDKESSRRAFWSKDILQSTGLIGLGIIAPYALPLYILGKNVYDHFKDKIDTKHLESGKERITGKDTFENTAKAKGFNLSDSALNNMTFAHGKIDPQTGQLLPDTPLSRSTGVQQLRKDLLLANIEATYGEMRNAYQPVAEWLKKEPAGRANSTDTINPYYEHLAKQFNDKNLFAGTPPTNSITAAEVKTLAKYIPDDNSLSTYDALSKAIEAEAAARTAGGGLAATTPAAPLKVLQAEADLNAAALNDLKKDLITIRAIDKIKDISAPPTDPVNQAKLTQLETEAKALPNSKVAEADKAAQLASKGHATTLKEQIEVDLVILNRLHEQKTNVSKGNNPDGSPRTTGTPEEKAKAKVDQTQAKEDLKKIEHDRELMRSWYLQLQGNKPVAKTPREPGKTLASKIMYPFLATKDFLTNKALAVGDFALGIKTNPHRIYTEKHGISNIKRYTFNIAEVNIPDSQGGYITKAGGISCNSRPSSPRMAEDMGMTMVSLAIKKGVPHPAEKGFTMTMGDGYSENKLRSALKSESSGDKKQLANSLHGVATMKIFGEALGITMQKPPSWERNPGVNPLFEDAMKNAKVTVDQLAQNKFGPSVKFDTLSPLQKVALAQEELKLKDHEVEPYLKSILANDPSIGRDLGQAQSDIHNIIDAATPQDASNVNVGAEEPDPEERTTPRIV